MYCFLHIINYKLKFKLSFRYFLFQAMFMLPSLSGRLFCTLQEANNCLHEFCMWFNVKPSWPVFRCYPTEFCVRKNSFDFWFILWWYIVRFSWLNEKCLPMECFALVEWWEIDNTCKINAINFWNNTSTT